MRRQRQHDAGGAVAPRLRRARRRRGAKSFTVLPVSLEDLRQITEMRQLRECDALRQSIARANLDWEACVVGAYHKLSKVEALVEINPERYGDAWERNNQEY